VEAKLLSVFSFHWESFEPRGTSIKGLREKGILLMQLYNTRTQQLEPFTARQEPVTLYVCGITPYDTTHLGHAFTYTAVDILVRYLEWQGHQVRYVQNVTDIDDDILRKAGEVGEDWRSLGNRWTTHFIEDMIALNVLPPAFFPRATGMIPPIIELVATLVAKGVAYVAAGNVYFAVDAWPDYGKLSHMDRAAMLPVANERGNNPDDPHKRDPLDFVLWQAQAPGEPAWASPWGKGRPGWHIECSTMSTTLLGNTIDLHSGGGDLLFPHHECEIAQVEGATGQEPFVRYWFHTAMVEHEGEKMSKSLGNLVMARDLLQEYTADALRLYMASHHYRQSWSYAEADLRAAQAQADRWRAAVTIASGPGPAVAATTYAQRMRTALDDDLATPAVITVLAELADLIHDGAQRGHALHAAQATLRTYAAVLGLRLEQAPDGRVQSGWEHHLADFAV